MSHEDKLETLTLWALTLTWPCDYAQIEKPRPAIVGSTEKAKPPLSISVHLDGCRRCMMQKNLLFFDEMLKLTAESSYEEFIQLSSRGRDVDNAFDSTHITEDDFMAISAHAQVVRDEILGCPK